MAKGNDNYTRTGGNFLSRWSAKVSAMPFIGNIPLLGSSLTVVLGSLGTLLDAGQWLLKGKVLSSVTALATGAVSTVVNGFLTTNALGVTANIGSSVMSGSTVGTHARKLTENTIGGLAGLMGQKPTVLRSYQAGIGSIGGAGVNGSAQTQQQPGYWANRVASEQGRDPQQRWQQYVDESRRDPAIAGGRA